MNTKPILNKFKRNLESGSSPRTRKAVQKIIKGKLEGYCPYLVNALAGEIEKPRAWQTQRVLIDAIGITGCADAIPYLKELTEEVFKATVLYKHLAFSIIVGFWGHPCRV